MIDYLRDLSVRHGSPDNMNIAIKINEIVGTINRLLDTIEKQKEEIEKLKNGGCYNGPK